MGGQHRSDPSQVLNNDQALSQRKPLAYYIDGLLASNRVVLGQAITLIESHLPSDQELASELLAHVADKAGQAFRLGLSGVPGAGKSTFIDVFGMGLIAQGHKVAVLSIDPSSTKSHGAILGDKTRMSGLSQTAHSFIRPTASGMALGGVHPATRDVITLCEVAGYDWIIVETVGVGQNEIEVAQLVDFVLLLMLGGAGDELQAIKRGILEVADAIVIHKADGDRLPAARLAKRELDAALHLYLSSPGSKPIPIMLASSLLDNGLAFVGQLLTQFQEEAQQSGDWQRKRLAQLRYGLHDRLQFEVLQQLYQNTELVTALAQFEAQLLASGQPLSSHYARVILKQLKSRL